MNLEIKQLSECPEHLDAVGTWIYEQWWRTPDNSPEVVLSLLRTHTEKDTVPFTVVALENKIPVGSCCVIENDCAHRPQYTPWVAAVFVKPDKRHCGIASRILQEAVRVAERGHLTGLYIDCHVNTSPVYEKNGWTVLEREVGDKESVVMLQRTASEQAN
jgi:GNAT superfamily N-acetyltransferase